MSLPGLGRRCGAVLAMVCALAALGACVPRVRMPTAAEMEPDKYLIDHGTAMLQTKHWLEAREYFRKLVDTYPQSQYRQDARLGIGDTYLGEGGYANLILAANAFREFLQFYPLNPKADYAQYKLAVSQYRQMLGPQRDQTATIDTLTEISTFLRNYPGSSYLADVLKMQRAARDRLSDAEFAVGEHYFRTRWYFGCIPRMLGILKDDPQYTHRDAVYYYLGESYYRTNRMAEALPYFEKLVEEFKVSDYLERAKARAAEVKHSLDSAPPTPAAGGEKTSAPPATPGSTQPPQPAPPAATPAH